jgi:hypothetical protein
MIRIAITPAAFEAVAATLMVPPVNIVSQMPDVTPGSTPVAFGN